MLDFTQKHRLKKRTEFAGVFAKSKKIDLPPFRILYQQQALSPSRLGIIVPKKLLKSAVHRNLVKRIVRESFRQHKECVKGLDIIVLLRTECTPLDKLQLRHTIDTLWEKLAALS